MVFILIRSCTVFSNSFIAWLSNGSLLSFAGCCTHLFFLSSIMVRPDLFYLRLKCFPQPSRPLLSYFHVYLYHLIHSRHLTSYPLLYHHFVSTVHEFTTLHLTELGSSIFSMASPLNNPLKYYSRPLTLLICT